MNYTLLKNYSAIFLLIFFISCSSDNNNDMPEIIEQIDYSEQNEEEIIAYISDNNLNATRSDSGLYYVVNEEGTGDKALATDNITVAYKGALTNGNVFDESEEFTADLNMLIAGWVEGIQNFKEGGSGILLIPAHLGYGGSTIPGIPAGSVLIYDITLISIN